MMALYRKIREANAGDYKRIESRARDFAKPHGLEPIIGSSTPYADAVECFLERDLFDESEILVAMKARWKEQVQRALGLCATGIKDGHIVEEVKCDEQVD